MTSAWIRMYTEISLVHGVGSVLSFRHNPAIWGGLVGTLLTAPLIAVFYAGYALAGLSFVPFHIFDWTTRMLPGPVVTFGIETMARIIRGLNLGATSTTAKTAEQSM